MSKRYDDNDAPESALYINGRKVLGKPMGQADIDGKGWIRCERQGFNFHSGDIVEVVFDMWAFGYALVIANARINAETWNNWVIIEFEGKEPEKQEVRFKCATI